MSRFARTGQQLAHQASQMPDPAAARAAGSEKEPEALMDETIILSNSTSGAMALVFWDDDDDEGNHDVTLDRDNLISMIVPDGSEKKRVEKPPASFMKRAAFVSLEKKGLTELPELSGSGIYYHSKSQQWHAAWPGGNRAPSWKVGLRSEKQAVLIALMALWMHFISLNPNNVHAKQHVKKLEAEMKVPED